MASLQPLSRRPIALLWLAIAIPPLVAYAIVFTLLLPIPILDDYHAILEFALHYAGLPSAPARLAYILTAQHNNYRLIFEHAILAAQLTLFHRLHFTTLILIGNLSILPMLLVLWKLYFTHQPDLRTRLLLFLPISYLFFSNNYVENLNYAMESLQNLPVVTFAFLAIYLLAANPARPFGWRLPTAFLCTVLSVASSANGLFLAPAGLLLLLIQRRFRALAAWVLLFACILPVYFWRFQSHPDHQPSSVAVRLFYFVSFLGGAVENMHRRPVPAAAIFLGAAITLVLLHALRRRIWVQNPAAAFTTLWLLITAAGVTYTRAGYGISQSLSSRYKIYSDLLIIFCYAHVIEFLLRAAPSSRRRQLHAVSIAASVLFFLASQAVALRFLTQRRTLTLDRVSKYLASPRTASPEIDFYEISPDTLMRIDEEYARTIMTAALQSGLYRLPPLPALK